MKVAFFHLMPYPFLPPDFEARYRLLLQEVPPRLGGFCRGAGLPDDCIRGLRVGHLMVLLQIGSMPKELTFRNTELFARVNRFLCD